MKKLPLVCGLLAAFLVVNPAGAFDDKIETPDPDRTLKQLLRNLQKQRNFEVSCQVLGGISQSKTHEVSAPTVQEIYRGSLYGHVLHVPEPLAFLTPKKGAIRNLERHDIWHAPLSTAEGKRLQKFFVFPQVILADALKQPQKMEWIWVGDENDEVEEPVVEEERKGRTAVAQETDKNRGLPHVIRVAMPEKISLDHFLQIQNSGCLSGG